jgi:deoxyribodipyrimidine photolyase-like uncharacterized protein
LSAALNLKLLNPRECVAAAVSAYESSAAPLNCVEGFVRQIIGWREFIRGVYWHEGPGYANRNELNQHGSLPPFYWDFLIRNRQRFRSNRRMAMILKNVGRLGRQDRKEIRAHARRLREQLGVEPEHASRSD